MNNSKTLLMIAALTTGLAQAEIEAPEREVISAQKRIEESIPQEESVERKEQTESLESTQEHILKHFGIQDRTDQQAIRTALEKVQKESFETPEHCPFDKTVVVVFLTQLVTTNEEQVSRTTIENEEAQAQQELQQDHAAIAFDDRKAHTEPSQEEQRKQQEDFTTDRSTQTSDNTASQEPASSEKSEA